MNKWMGGVKISMRQLWKYSPVIILCLVIILIFLPQYSTKSQSSRTEARGLPAASFSETDEIPQSVEELGLTLEDQFVYLPLVIKSSAEQPPSGVGIYGTVTAYGEPVGGIILALWHDKDQITETITLSDGSYAFTDAPSLNVGESYNAVYMNTTAPKFLNYYRTPKLISYTAGTNVHLSDFDIGNIDLISPEDSGIKTVPVEFAWDVRPEMTTDSYSIVFHNNTNLETIYESEKLGYVGSYSIEDISDVPMFLDVEYLWEVWVYSPDGGNGISHEWWQIILQSELGIKTTCPQRIVQ